MLMELFTIGSALIGANNRRKQANKGNAYNDAMYDINEDYRELNWENLLLDQTQVGLDESLLDYQGSYLKHKGSDIRGQMDLDRAKLLLQGKGIDITQDNLDFQELILKDNLGLYNNMMGHQQTMTDAVRKETMQKLNTNFEGMNVQKQQIEDQNQQQQALRGIQALRERSNIMLMTGEANVGGSSVERAVFQLANDEALQQAGMSKKTQGLLMNLSQKARNQQLDAGHNISNALRQGLMNKMQMLKSKNGLISQISSNRTAKLQTYLDRQGLKVAEAGLELDYNSAMRNLDLEQYKLGYQSDLNQLKLDRLDLDFQRNELQGEKNKANNKYNQNDYSLFNMFAEVAPTAYYVGADAGWWNGP